MEMSNAEIMRQQHGKGMAISLVCVILLTLGGSGYMIHHAKAVKNDTRVQLVETNNEIKNLKGKLKKINNRVILDPDTGEDELVSAVKEGDELARLQNSFPSAGSSDRKLHAIQKQLVKLYATPKIDTTPWYNTGKKGDQGTWKFESRYSFSQEEVDVVFTNTSKDGRLLAYTTAVYYPKKKVFDKIKVHVTVDGQQSSDATDKESKKQYKKNIDKDVESMKKITKGKNMPKTKPSSKADLKKQMEQRQKLEEKAKKEGKYDYGD